MKLFSAAYRNQHGEIQLIGTPDPSLDLIASVVRHANRDEPTTRFFIAETEQVWREWNPKSQRIVIGITRGEK